MLPPNAFDHRFSSDERLSAALRDGDALALAEAYHRTVGAGHAVARRLFASSAQVEALLHAVYAGLWESPPDASEAVMLEGWVRRRCFDLATDELRQQGTGPVSPSSAAALLPDLPQPQPRALDPAERALANLDDAERRTLLLAHDQGIPSSRQDEAGAAEALHGALVTLAGTEAQAEPLASCDVDGLADWVLGLVSPAESERIAAAVEAEPGCTALVRVLRRGRRRLEGLPPTPDMGPRIIAAVLSGSQRAEPVATSAPTAAEPAGPDEVASEALGTDAPAVDEDTLKFDDLVEDTSKEEATTKEEVPGTPEWYERELAPTREAAAPSVPEDDREDDVTTYLSGAYEESAEAERPTGPGKVAMALGVIILLALGGAVGLLWLGPMIAEWIR